MEFTRDNRPVEAASTSDHGACSPGELLRPRPLEEPRRGARKPSNAAAPPLPIGFYRSTGRACFGALLVLMLLCPVALVSVVVALLQLVVERDPKAVFFVQKRAGRHGKPFWMWKFRTLSLGPDNTLVATRLGRVLRKTHIDEFPQLWNVLRGEMSLIGPRPESIEVEEWAEARIPGFGSRLVIAPGITGLAQVVQDSTPLEVDLYEEKLRLNHVYISGISLKLDAQILLRTAFRPLRPRHFNPGVVLPTSSTTEREASECPEQPGGQPAHSSAEANTVDASPRCPGPHLRGSSPCSQSSNTHAQNPLAPLPSEGVQAKDRETPRTG